MWAETAVPKVQEQNHICEVCEDPFIWQPHLCACSTASSHIPSIHNVDMRVCVCCASQLSDAVELAKGVEGVYGPGEKPYLAYNLSPSFNWDACGMTDKEIHTFCKDLGKLGFTWQFVTLAGFHLSSLNANRLCRTLVEQQSMLGYVEGIQRPEREEEVRNPSHYIPHPSSLIPHPSSLIAHKSFLKLPDVDVLTFA